MATLAPFASRALHSRVSVTLNASAAISIGVGRSMRRNTIPVVRRSRTQGHGHFLAGVQADAGGADYGFEGALLEHLIAGAAGIIARSLIESTGF